jgi:hypothetical protein
LGLVDTQGNTDIVTQYLPNLGFVAVIIFLLWAITRVVSLVFREIEKGTIKVSGFDPEWARLTARIVNFLLLAGGAVVMYPYLPSSDSVAFKGVTVFLGLVLSLSSTSRSKPRHPSAPGSTRCAWNLRTTAEVWARAAT